jgi:hypothetical protein
MTKEAAIDELRKHLRFGFVIYHKLLADRKDAIHNRRCEASFESPTVVGHGFDDLLRPLH